MGDASSTGRFHLGMYISSLSFMRGGLETLAAQLAGGLAERGQQVTLVAGYPPGRSAKQAPVELPIRLLQVPCLPASWAAWRRLARRRPGLPLMLQSLSFVYACRLHPQVRELTRGADVSLSFFEIETVALSAWRRRYARPHISYFPGVIDRRRLQRDCSILRLATSGALARQVEGLPGVSIDGVLRPGVPARWLEQGYSVRPEARMLVFVGRLEAGKGVWELLAIFEALAAEFPRLGLRLVGEGPLRQALEARLQRGPAAGRGLCLGPLPAEELRQELCQADLFVFPSHHESFGIAALEAQAVGVPVVASDIPALRESAGAAAALLPVKQPRLWVETIRALLVDYAARCRMSRAGRERARGFTWSRAAKDLEDYCYLALDRY